MGWEFTVLDWIQNNLRCSFLDVFMPMVTSLANGGWFWIMLTLLGFISPKTRKYAHIAAVGLLLCVICGNVILKPVLARIRPYDVQTTVQLLVAAQHDYSFPSGHTQASFAVATAIFFWDKRFGIPALVLAGLIAFSRMYLYLHYPTDILAGIAFGVGFAWVGRLIANRLFAKKPWAGCQTKKEEATT